MARRQRAHDVAMRYIRRAEVWKGNVTKLLFCGEDVRGRPGEGQRTHSNRQGDATEGHRMTQTIETRSEWRGHPANKWSFRNIEKIIPTAIVSNDRDAITPLAHAGTRWTPSLLQRWLVNFTSTDALVMLVDGVIAFEYYANGNGPETRHILMSCSKAVTGLLLGILAEERAIAYEAPVTRYVPEITGTRYAGATIRNLIDMRAGVVLDAAEQRAYELAGNWEPAASTPPTANLKSFLKSLRGPPATHGGPFRYISANTDLLGWAIERATDRTVADLLGEKLWSPLRAEHSAGITLDQDGLARCAGGFCATARDFARLGQVFLSQGRYGDRQVVPAAVIDDICHNADLSAWAKGELGRILAPVSRNMGCRSGWYIVNEAPRRVFAMGIHGQNLFIDLENRIVVAKLSSWKRANDPLPFLATHWVFAHLGVG
jgi:CubicO group peptidase (beta-lactamase class C family)